MSKVETNVDILLSIVDLNRSKAHLLERMRKLELADQTKKELIQLIDAYELICSTINQKLKRIDLKKREELHHILLSLNESFFQNNMDSEIDLCAMLTSSEHEKIIFRTFLDLVNGEIPLQFYESSQKNNFVQMFGFFGIQLEQQNIPKEDSKTINQYMIMDYIRMIYFVIESNLRQLDVSPKTKEELMQLKYNAIFMFDVIEERQLMTRFSPSNEPALIDRVSIEATGISLEKYLKKLDETLIDLLIEFFSALNEKLENENINLSIVDKIRLQSCVALLYNKKRILSPLSDFHIEEAKNEQQRLFIQEFKDAVQTFSGSEYQYQRKYPRF